MYTGGTRIGARSLAVVAAMIVVAAMPFSSGAARANRSSGGWTGTLTITRLPYSTVCGTPSTPPTGCNITEKTVWTLNDPISATQTKGTWTTTESYLYPGACPNDPDPNSDVGTASVSGTGTYEIDQSNGKVQLVSVWVTPGDFEVEWPCGYSYEDIPDVPGAPDTGVAPLYLSFAADGTLTGETKQVNGSPAQGFPPNGLPGVTQVIDYDIHGIQPPKTTTTNATTTTTKPLTPTFPSTFGVNCGVDKFDWYDVTLDEMPERKGAESCIFLLSNQAAIEVLQNTLASKGGTLTNSFGNLILAARKGIPNAPVSKPGEPALPTGFNQLITEKVKDETEEALKQQGWKVLAPDVAEALDDIGILGDIPDAVGAVGLAAVPLADTFIINEINADNACVQLDATVAGGKLHVDWNLIYSPSALKDPVADKGLTETSASSRQVRRFAFDKLHSHGASFACDSDGNVKVIGTGAGIFSHPVTQVS